MSGLRTLALSYLASAAVFVLAATYAAHPDLGGALRVGAGRLGALLDEGLWQPVLRTAQNADKTFLDRLDDAPYGDSAVTIAIEPPGPNDARTLARSRTLDIAPRSLDPQALTAPGGADADYSASTTITILPDLTPLPEAPAPRLAERAPSAPPVDIARNAPPVVIPEPPPLEADRLARNAPGAHAPQTRAAARAMAVSERLKENLTPDMLKGFDLFLYVSKSEHGPLAQRMYVFRKQAGGRLALLYDWPASTGREQRETSPRGRSTFTDTPRGYYELDPDRMYRKYTSYSWKQPMPYAMFFNWERRGLQTGLAIHAASGDDIALLGQRASAGCVHLAPENARTLYELIRSEYKGEVPRFAYNSRTQTMSNDGTLMRDANGDLKMADGYKVLVQIEDYAGDNSVAALF